MVHSISSVKFIKVKCFAPFSFFRTPNIVTIFKMRKKQKIVQFLILQQLIIIFSINYYCFGDHNFFERKVHK